jgi:hypothetical protein
MNIRKLPVLLLAPRLGVRLSHTAQVEKIMAGVQLIASIFHGGNDGNGLSRMEALQTVRPWFEA